MRCFFRLQQRAVFASRISEVVTFRGLALEEVQMLATELCSISLNDEGAEKLLAATDGYIRDAVVALAHLEQACKASKLEEAPADMVDQVAKRHLLRAA